jgi:NCS2 family nucleobase:cation symporter-2/xanthine permease XanP
LRSSGTSTNQGIRYEAEEHCPLWVSLSVGLQGTVFALAPLVLIVAITARAGGQDEGYISWAVFASLIISGCLTALQASRLWRVGAGYVLIMGTTPNFVAISVLALSAGGPTLLASLVVVGSLSYLALAVWLPLLRRVITPVVSATVLMLIAVAVLPISLDRVQEVPQGAPVAAGPTVAAITLAVIVGLALRTSGAWRLWSPLMGLGAGCAVALLFGIYDVQRLIDAPWVGIPLGYTPGFDLTLGPSFWALLPVFVVVTLVGGIKNIGDNVAIQQASRRGQQVTDYRRVQSSLNTNWLGILAAGIAGTPPTTVYSSTSVSLVNLTGVASRRVGYVIGACLVVLALFPKLPAVLLTIPSPVMGAYLLLAVGLLFMEGIRTLIQSGLDSHKVIVVGISFSLGAGIEQQTIFADLLGGPWGRLLDNGMLAGALAAILMTLFLDLTNPRRSSRIQVRLDSSALPEIHKFARGQAARLNWNEGSTEKLLAASEEALASLVGDSDQDEASRAPRLVVVARPEPGMVELEFMAVFDETNLEDQLAHLNEEAEDREEGEISLRLLRHYAASVRHQKYYGLDIVTVQVRGSR